MSESVDTRASRWRSLAVVSVAYLALSIALWWHVWSNHPTSTTTCGCGDSSLFTWFLAWPAYAISHGLNPLFSTYLFHPSGINLLSNTAEAGLGIPLSPVTWLWGPITTLNVALTLSPALSALAAFLLLRRWVAWTPAAFFGGLIYGFSPFVVVSLSDAHLMVGMAPVAPLLALCLDEALARQQWSPWVTGGALGLCAVVQFFIGTEMLVLLAVAAAVAVVLVVVGAGLWRRDAFRRRVPYALRSIGSGAVLSGVVLAWPVWFALAGPAHLSGAVWGSGGLLAYGGNTLRYFVTPLPPATRITTLTHQLGGYQGTTVSGQFLGWGIVVVGILGLVLWWRDLRLWLFASLGVVAALLSQGLAFRHWTPWRLFVRLPQMVNVIPSRLGLVVYLCAAVLLGLIVDKVRTALATRRLLASAVAAGIAVVAITPMVTELGQGGLPLVAVPVVLPSWFATEAPHLPPKQVLLVFPFAFRQSNMTWQAVNAMPYSMAGGGGPNSLASRAGRQRAGQTVLSNISLTGGSPTIDPSQVAAVRSALAGWQVTGVVLPDPAPLPLYEQVFAVRSIVVLVTAATGQAPRYTHQAWVWTGLTPVRLGPLATSDALQRCAQGPERGSVPSLLASATCVLGSESRQ